MSASSKLVILIRKLPETAEVAPSYSRQETRGHRFEHRRHLEGCSHL